METRKNAVPQRFKAYFITPGNAGYPREVGGNVLIRKPALDKMLPTFIGKPVIVEHNDLDPDEMFNMARSEEPVENFADGVVSDVGFDEASGWYYAIMLVWSKEGLEVIENGYSVSCAYDITELDDSGGTYNNVEYLEEVLDGEYVHMALTATPRYEQAYILKNSKGEKMAVKFFQKKTVKNADPEPEKKKPEEEDPAMENMDEMDGVVVDEDGNEYPIEELVNTYRKNKENSGKMYNMDDEVEIDGEKMSVKELMAACGYGPKNENAESPLDDDAEDVVDESKQMQNSSESAAAKKKPNENFKKVKNAAGKTQEPIRNLNTASERIARGQSRYGKIVKQEAK